MTLDPQALTAAEGRIISALRAIGRWAGPNLSAAIEAALEGPAQTGWRDISTAPKDGRPLLILIPYDTQIHPYDQCVDIGWWADGCFRFHGDDGPDDLQPTHWQPLPLPPVGSGRNLADANSKSPIQAREE